MPTYFFYAQIQKKRPPTSVKEVEGWVLPDKRVIKYQLSLLRKLARQGLHRLSPSKRLEIWEGMAKALAVQDSD
ncbi:MAG: hypothetical protein RIG63_23385 [Coleofasciculus chthonoplastes F3-SA18-01]